MTSKFAPEVRARAVGMGSNPVMRRSSLAMWSSKTGDFAAKVTTGPDTLDRHGARNIIRTVVREIEIGDPGLR